MTLALVVLQEPEAPASQVVNMTLARVTALPKAYLILVDVSDEVQFFTYLDGFLSKELKNCRRDRNLIFTSKAMSFDPVQRIMAWVGDWIKSTVTATPV